MRILLLNLPRFKETSVTRERRCEELVNQQVISPTTLLTIASILRNKGNTIMFLDANAYNKSFQDIAHIVAQKKVDCIIFSLNHRILDYDLLVCEAVKQVNKSCKTIGFSWFVKGFSKELLAKYPLLDILMVNDPFTVVEPLIKCLSENENLELIDGIAYRDYDALIKVTSPVHEEQPLRKIPMPAYDLLPTMKPYHLFNRFFSPLALVLSSKGCPFKCKFCNVSNTKYDCRPPPQVIEELKFLQKTHHVKFVWFYDEIFTYNKQRVKEICRLIIQEKIKIKWFCDTRVDLVDNDLLSLMHKAGCIGISFGVESGSPAILSWMHKQITPTQCETAIRLSRQQHVPMQMNILLCPDQETSKTVNDTWNLVRRSLPDKLQIAPIDAHPGSDFGREKFAVLRKTEAYSWLDELEANYPFDEKTIKLIQTQITAIKQTLQYNPKWWVNSLVCLLWNRSLILPLIGGYLDRRP